MLLVDGSDSEDFVDDVDSAETADDDVVLFLVPTSELGVKAAQ